MNEYITVKFENEKRKFEYNEDTMTLVITDTCYVDKTDVPEIIQNIKNLNDSNCDEII